MGLSRRWAVSAALLTVVAVLMLSAGRLPAQKAKKPVRGHVLYKNDKYEFCFALPADWKGYKIVPREWNGNAEDGGPDLVGPLLLIRNPGWTEENPTEDIPIMIFTLAEWQRVNKGDVAVSAAPIGPSELGQNSHYVFALPPRWNFDDLPGLQEIGTLLQGNPFKAPCGGAGGS